MDVVELKDQNKGSDKVVVQRGPQVLAVDDMLDTRDHLPAGWIGVQFYLVKGKQDGKAKVYRMVPFADAGQTLGHYDVLIDRLENIELSNFK